MELNLEHLLTLKQAAQKLQVHTETLKRAIRSGELEAYRVGRNYRVSEEALNTYVRTHRVEVK